MQQGINFVISTRDCLHKEMPAGQHAAKKAGTCVSAFRFRPASASLKMLLSGVNLTQSQQHQHEPVLCWRRVSQSERLLQQFCLLQPGMQDFPCMLQPLLSSGRQHSNHLADCCVLSSTLLPVNSGNQFRCKLSSGKRKSENFLTCRSRDFHSPAEQPCCFRVSGFLAEITPHHFPVRPVPS